MCLCLRLTSWDRAESWALKGENPTLMNLGGAQETAEPSAAWLLLPRPLPRQEIQSQRRQQKRLARQAQLKIAEVLASKVSQDSDPALRFHKIKLFFFFLIKSGYMAYNS